MNNELWKKCLDCKENCCFTDISSLLFITEQEKTKIPEINSCFPCKFLDKKGLCKIHKIRPIDCRIFPFDIKKIDKKFFWIIRRWSCPILREEKNQFENYLQFLEKEIVPDFKDFVLEYAEFRRKEFEEKYGYEILREIK